MAKTTYARESAQQFKLAIGAHKQGFIIGAVATGRYALDLALADLLETSGITISRGALDSTKLLNRCLDRGLIQPTTFVQLRKSLRNLGSYLHGRQDKPSASKLAIFHARMLAKTINPAVAAAIADLNDPSEATSCSS